MRVIDRVGPLAAVRRPRPRRQQRQVVAALVMFEHLDGVGPHAGVGVRQHAVQQHVGRDHRQLPEHADRLGADLGVYIGAQLHQDRPQRLGQAQFMRDQSFVITQFGLEVKL